jgi:hypothetical protein
MVCSKRFVALAEGIGRLQLQRDLVAGLLALQRGLDARQRVAVAAVQVGRGLLGFLDQLALKVGNLVAQGDDGVFFDFHGRVRWAGLWLVGAIFAQPSATPWRRHRIAHPYRLDVRCTSVGPPTGSRW